MNIEDILEHEETLDPQNWDELKELGHKMVDDIIEFQKDYQNGPIWKYTPEGHIDNFQKPVPETPEDIENVYSDFKKNVLPYPKGNIHPRFWGWVMGSGTVLGTLSGMLKNGMNTDASFGDQSSVMVELQIINWFKDLFGYPSQAEGLLTSGGSMANFIAMVTARNVQTGLDVRKKGVKAANGAMTLYCSNETHYSVQKAVEMMGIGSDALRKLPVDDDYRIVVSELTKAIAEDKAQGNVPFCIIGNAGTINTGAIDPLDELADIAEKENLWYHVDGAFGAIPAIVPEYKHHLTGMDRADSIAFDLHKWMYMPYESGCTLIRRKNALEEAFKVIPDYLIPHERGVTRGPVTFSLRGPQLSRDFKALSIWMSIKEHGMTKYRRLIRQNIAQAKYIEDLVNNDEKLEMLAPVPMNVVCFRYIASGIDDKKLDWLNKEIVMSIQEKGIAITSSTLLKGKYAIRLAITNHRTKKSDLELFLDEVKTLGEELVSKMHTTQSVTENI